MFIRLVVIMWIRDITDNYLNNLGEYCTYLNFLWKSDSAPIYIMDNHMAAAWCWMQECSSDEDYNFMHIDKHSDLKGCGHPANIEFLKTNKAISLADYIQITYTTYKEFQFFQWDNYIRACHYLYPNWFNTNLFYYTQSHKEHHAEGWGYDPFPEQSMDALYVRQGISQFIQNKETFSSTIFEERMREKKWIVNIDLDFFWDFDKTKVFDDQFIQDMGKRISDAMNNIQVLTIALSPSCCNGWKNALECLKTFLFNPVLIESCLEYLEEKQLFPDGWH